MRAGTLRHPVTIQQASSGTYSPATGSPGTWTTVATTRVSIEPMAGRERILALQTEGALPARMRLRYRPGIVPKMRVLWGTRVFEIVSVANLGERNREIELTVVERQ